VGKVCPQTEIRTEHKQDLADQTHQARVPACIQVGPLHPSLKGLEERGTFMTQFT